MKPAVRLAHTRSACRSLAARFSGLPWLALALPLLAVACAWAGWDIELNNDVSWQYWIARQLRSGARMYTDIVDVNPPLWFWEAVPVSALADFLRIDTRHLVVVAVMFRAMLAIGLTAMLSDGKSARQRFLLLAGLVMLLGLLPLHDFGEREHLMLLGALPYMVLIARHRARQPVSPWLAAAVGLYAAYGFAMKPHFALVPLGLEIWLALTLRANWRLLRPELIALAVVAAVYGAAILLFAPDYLRLTVPLARLAYGAFAPAFWSLIVYQPWMPAWVLGAAALLSARRGLPVEAQAASVAALALASIYLVQGKGYLYHALPVTAALGWALWCVVVRGDRTASRVTVMALPATALAVLIATGVVIGGFSPVRAGKATLALERLPAGSVVAVISAHSWLAFPLVETHRFVWPLRDIGLWTIPKIARDGDGPTASSDGLALRRQTLDGLAADLWCHPPDAVLFDDPARSPALGDTHFNYEAFARSDIRIRSMMLHYRRSVSDAGATVYRRVGAIVPHGTGCRSISIRPDFG